MHRRRGGGIRGLGPRRLSRLVDDAAQRAGADSLPDEGPDGRPPRRADPPRVQGKRQGPGRGPRGCPQGHRGRRVRLRRDQSHDGALPGELQRRLRHGPVSRASRRVRRHRPLELPRHDTHGLDGPTLYSDGQHHRPQGGELHARDRPARRRALERGWATQRRTQHSDLLARRGRDTPPASRYRGRHLRRLHGGGTTHL